MTIQKLFLSLPSELHQDLIRFTTVYQKAGYQCLLVGGSVRDMLLGEAPYDFDFATDCPLEISKTLFSKVLPTGVPQGTVTILFRGHQFEVTRFRKDVETDGRRAVVEFSDNIEDDQIRRDLKINAIAYDILTDTIYDSQGGMADIAEKKIHFVGNAKQRVVEDHLRALRYIRMVNRLKPYGFQFDREEMKAVLEVFDPSHLSLERIYDELGKILKLPFELHGFLGQQLLALHPLVRLTADPEQAKLMYQQLLEMKDLLPLAYHALKAGLMEPNQMRFSKKTMNFAKLLLEVEAKPLQENKSLKAVMARVASTDIAFFFSALSIIQGVDLQGRVQEIIEKHEPLTVKELQITTTELQALGLQGPELGEAQKQLLAYVWEEPEQNKSGILLQLAESLAKSFVSTRSSLMAKSGEV